jgi:hypothetical protein
MNENPRVTLIEGGYVDQAVDLTDLLENMPVEQAIPLLRQMSRQRKAAANSVLEVVQAGSPEAT